MFRFIFNLCLLCSISYHSFAQVKFEQQVQITDKALFFDGQQISGSTAPNTGSDYDYKFGPAISPHGDCIKTYKEYVFMTWYRGGKEDRHVMLTRYNTLTGTMKTIEFPHRHTGYLNQWWIGETHNTIAIGISPKNGTIHLVYDMHGYSNTRPSDGSLANDYLRYSFSKNNAVEVPDEEFTLDQFVKDGDGDYKHLTMTGVINHDIFSGLTYPKFFLNDEGDLFLYVRKGGDKNGKFTFIKYDGVTTWGDFTDFNVTEAESKGNAYNWGLYGSMKYVDGKIRLGFQQRANLLDDRYLYQNGIYYAYSDDPTGKSNWKNHRGESFSLPLINSDKIKVYEPGDLVATMQKDKVYIVRGFDWTVTDSGDVHIISMVKDNQYNVTKKVHTYKPAGETEFITTTNFRGAEALYTSGKNIYIIGLNTSGRVYIEKAEGGTNNFQKIYEATSGTIFDKGVVYISEGKLYYYLKGKGTGDKRPTYLQVIDLGISGINTSAKALDDAPFELLIYPNPTDASFTIQLKENVCAAVIINDLNGRMIYRTHMNSQSLQLSKNSLFTRGMYLVKVVAENQKTYHGKLTVW